jgi:hypothetical protein
MLVATNPEWSAIAVIRDPEPTEARTADLANRRTNQLPLRRRSGHDFAASASFVRRLRAAVLSMRLSPPEVVQICGSGSVGGETRRPMAR